MATHQASALGLFTTLLSTREAAELKGVHEKTILRWVKSGRLSPAHKTPGQTGGYIFTAEEVARVGPQRRRRRKAAA